MADKKSRFGFGAKEDIGTAVEAGTINEYDFLCLDMEKLVGLMLTRKQ